MSQPACGHERIAAAPEPGGGAKDQRRSTEVEQAVLGALLLDPSAWGEVEHRVEARQFSLPAHRHVFTACAELMKDGQAIDPVLVNHRLDARGLLGSAVPRDLVLGLARGVGASGNVAWFAEAVAELYETRRRDPSGVLARNGIVPIASIPKERITWAWPGRFAFGKHTDLSGDPGDGKSLLLVALAAQVTRGLPLPYGTAPVREPRPVLFLSTEDDAADTIRPRFEAAGGDVNLLHVQRDTHHLVLPGSSDELLEIIRDLRAGMVVIDPLFSYIGDLDPNAYSASVAVCDPLKRIASEAHCILATLRHLNKAAGASARYRAGGSIGWQAKPRVVLSLGRDPEDRDVRVLTFIKGNVGAEPRAATFRVNQAVIDGEAQPVVLWGDERTVSADEVHGTEGASAKGPTKTEVVASYIRDRLATAGEDGLTRDELKKDVEASLRSHSPGTFQRARMALGADLVEFKSDPDAPRSPLRWRLRET